MLLVPFAIFVFALLIYVYAVRALEEPAGTRWLWLASVVAVGAALATNDEDGISTPVKIAAWVVAVALFALAALARDRAEDAA